MHGQQCRFGATLRTGKTVVQGRKGSSVPHGDSVFVPAVHCSVVWCLPAALRVLRKLSQACLFYRKGESLAEGECRGLLWEGVRCPSVKNLSWGLSWRSPHWVESPQYPILLWVLKSSSPSAAPSLGRIMLSLARPVPRCHTPQASMVPRGSWELLCPHFLVF